MRTRKPLFRESADEATLKDIEDTYGKKTALALDKYCRLFKKNPTNVVSDMKADGNGMTEWDKFDVWARRKLKVDIMGNFDDTIDWTGADEKKKADKEEKKREKDKRRTARKFRKGLKELRKNKKDLKKLRRGLRRGRGLARESMEPEFEPMSAATIADWLNDQLSKRGLVGHVGTVKVDGDGTARFSAETEDGGLFSITVSDIG